MVCRIQTSRDSVSANTIGPYNTRERALRQAVEINKSGNWITKVIQKSAKGL